MNPEIGLTLKVTMEDAIAADEIFTILMVIRWNLAVSLLKTMQNL